MHDLRRRSGATGTPRRMRGFAAVRLATPLAVAALTVLVTALTTTLDAFKLPVAARLAIVGGGSVLAGLIALVSQRGVRHFTPQGAPRSDGVAAPAQLPPVIAHFTGRADYLARLHHVFTEEDKRSEEWSGSLVVSVHGPGGVGKSALVTRFAHEVAGHYPDGQLYCDLRGSGDVRVRMEDVLTGFLLALGVRLTTDPGGLPDLQKLWWTWLKGRRVLIFLDNARHADQVQAVVPPEAGCAVLVTSRQPLYLRNTLDVRLQEFTELQAVELLARLAGDERVAEDDRSAVRIAELCDRLPLAVSICGGRLAARRTWSLEEMADRLGDERRRRLDELETDDQIDKSVRATLWLSYEDCTDLQRRLLRSFALLSVPDLPGWAAGSLLGTSKPDGGDQLEALVDAQLMEYSGKDPTDTGRYRLHDLVRLYARERADREDTDEQRRATVDRILAGYRRRAELAAAVRWPQDWRRHARRGEQDSGEIAPEPWFYAEHLTLLACVEQAASLEMWEEAWRVGRAFCSLSHSMRLFWQEWHAVAETTLRAASRLEDPRSIGIALMERAAASGGLGKGDLARRSAEEALAVFEELREPWWAARAERTVGVTLRDAGNLDEAQRHLLAAIGGFAAVGDRWWHARTQRNLAELRLAQGRHQEARALLDEALGVFESDGNRYSEAQTLRVLGEVSAAEAADLRARGDILAGDAGYNRAAQVLERAAEMFRLRHEQWEEARCLRAAGEVGDPKNGLRELTFVRRAMGTLEGLGDSWGVARTELSEGRALNRLGRVDEAVTALGHAAAVFHELGDRWLQARCLRTLAEILADAGRPAEARGPAEEGLRIYRSLGNEVGETRARNMLARVLGSEQS
ncbi:tetratricopeptide repeat protein [Actinomadura sp. DC4]|uniref:ATP-binding protein n=1 Tax=Actinomadura sp. DC4 TaxID=3055069 RepID=UPI0025B18F7D|nr:tetratricopeptide repeat protein [Actinomadura sp. DC4]MDN3351228.1 tetratricopeptide repeat protein [Actinomadura sp. DC4]